MKIIMPGIEWIFRVVYYYFSVKYILYAPDHPMDDHQ